jgi:hypothetical protein
MKHVHERAGRSRIGSYYQFKLCYICCRSAVAVQCTMVMLLLRSLVAIARERSANLHYWLTLVR